MDTVREAAENCKHNAALKGLLVKIAENDNVPRKKAKFLNFIRNSMRVNNANLVSQAWEEIEKAGKPVVVESKPVVEKVVVEEEVVEEEVTKTKKKKKKGKGEPVEEVKPVVEETAVPADEAEVKPKKRKRVKSINLNTDVVTAEKKKKKTKKDKENEPGSLKMGSLDLNPNLNHVNGIAPDTPGKAQKFSISNSIQEIVFEKEEISIKKLKRKVLAAYLEYNPHKSPDEASRLFDKKVMKVAGVAVEHGTASKEELDIAES